MCPRTDADRFFDKLDDALALFAIILVVITLFDRITSADKDITTKDHEIRNNIIKEMEVDDPCKIKPVEKSKKSKEELLYL
jgi:hypothetical protein